MEWLLIIFLLMFVIAPVMWLKPSPRQKRVARLRDMAMKAGVEVKLTKSPLHNDSGTMPSYRWPYPPQRPGPRFLLVRDVEASDRLKTFCPGWRWRIEPMRGLPDTVEARLKALLERLPQDALVIESGREALLLWWHESQDGERFTRYLDDFRFIRDALAGRPDPRASSRSTIDPGTEKG